MKAKERKKQRRKEAEARQTARANRTDVEQLAKLGKEGWAATKEKIRLNERIMATMEAAEKKETPQTKQKDRKSNGKKRRNRHGK